MTTLGVVPASVKRLAGQVVCRTSAEPPISGSSGPVRLIWLAYMRFLYVVGAPPDLVKAARVISEISEIPDMRRASTGWSSTSAPPGDRRAADVMAQPVIDIPMLRG
jgi:hypothetical protein